MPLTIYGFHDRPHDFAVTKVGAEIDECEFLLDFSRPLERIRWLGIANRLVGPTVSLLIPVVHQGEETGGYVISLNYGQPYFADIPRLWREHQGSKRSIAGDSVGGLEIVTAFARHFPEDSQ